jgi:kynureninase
MEPAAVGWISHARPFDFTVDDIEFAPGVMRFAGGTPNVAAALAAEPAYAAVAEAGVAAIRARSVTLTQPIVEAAVEAGFVVNSPSDPARRGGHVTVDPAPGDIVAGQAICEEMIRRRVIVDYRPGSGVRIAPHFYNDVSEGLHALSVMAGIRAGAA